MDEIKDFEKLEGLSWENFFEQVDKLYVSSEDENDEKNEEAAFSGVATLPHDKAVCYGVCTVSQVPKLVRCEDCSLVVKLVGFGHHRKFRHRESRLLTRQSVKNPDDSSNSDSNDDCQGFLLSPPHHHLSSVASTSESCTFESQQWRLTHPSETCSTSNQSQRNATRVNKQPPKEAPRLYDVEKRNDLRLVLKRTPEKPSSDPQRNTDVNTRLHLNQNIQEQKTPEEVLFKKSSKKPSSKSIISKKKRKKKDSRRPKDLGQEANEEEEDSPEGVYQQSPTNDFQECDTFTDDADPDDDSFVTIPMQLTPSNDDSFVTIPTQLTPVTAASFWDPRESAGRPDAVKGTFKRAPLNNRLTANSVPIRKTMLNLSARQFQVCSNSIGTEINNKKDDNLDKIAGPSILKRPGQIMSPQQQHIQRTEEKTPVHKQIPNKYSSINTSNNYKKQISEELPQNQFLQNQFSKMQQQMQKRRVLTRDFDAISPRNIRKPLTEEVNNNNDSQHSHSPSSDTSSSTSNIYMDTQDNLTTTDLLNNSKLPNVGTQTEEEFSNSNKFVQNVERFSKIHSEKSMINTQKPATMYRLFTRNSPNGGSNECKTMIVKSNVNTLWKGNDSNSSETSLTQQQRKISNASFSGRGHYITPSGTRFVPVDPRGLVSLQKNSASNSITSSKSNSPVAAPIPSTPSPASYTNSPSRCELINTNVDVRTSREVVQNSSFEDNYEHITTTPKTNTIPSRRQQQQQLPQQQQQKQHPFPPTQTMLNSFFRKRPFIDEIPQQSIMTPTRYQQQRIPSIQQQHNFKRFRPLVPQETDHQQYASCVDSFTSDARIHQSSRIRTIYPKKQQHSSSSNFSISPIPSSSSSTIGFSEQQQQQTSSYQYQTNQIINQRMHLTSQQKQQQNYSSPQNSQFRQQQQQSFTPRHHYYKQQNLMLRNNNLLNRGLSTSTNYFPKSLSSLSGEFALEHPHYTQQRFQYEKQQQQFINTEDTSFNEYIIGSPPPPSEQQQQIFSERMTSGGIYEQVENSSGINIMRRTDQLPPSFSYNTSTPIISSTPNRRLLPPPSYNSQQQNYSSSNRFSSSQQIAHNNNNTISSFLQSPSCVQLSMDYNNIQQQQQRFHQRTIKQPEYRPGIDSIDSHVIDPPPVLEAEGRLSSIEIIQPVYNNNTRQLGGVVCSNESVVNNLSTPNKINHSNEEDPGTRSSSASDLDLREIVHNPSSK